MSKRIRIGASVDEEIYREFKSISDKTKVPVSKLLDEAMLIIIRKFQNNGKLFDESKEEDMK